MTTGEQEIIRDAVALTGIDVPDWSMPDAPVLQTNVETAIYFIGVIGGKDVGKSSLVNAILGRDVAMVIGHGEGTSRAMAYVHEADALAAAAILEQSAPGAFDLVKHTIDDARGRVLLDLPDVDSVWNAHVELSRRMLRYMLFPVWVQSIEKYADHAPLALLARVASGNAPENFHFVLTKADQLAKRHGAAAVEELKADFAQRAARACKIDHHPPVYAVDGLTRQGFDLRALTEALLESRTTQSLAAARRLAEMRLTRTLNDWLSQLRIDDQLAGARRALEDAERTLSARVIEPLAERLAKHPAPSSLVEPAVRARISHWPIIAAMDAVLGPVLSVFRSRAEPWTEQSIAGRQIGQHVRGVFADLAQRQPLTLQLYGQHKLWEAAASERAAEVLAEKIAAAGDARRSSLMRRVAMPSILERLAAVVLTVAAALWFPIVQPVLEIVLQKDITHFTKETLLLVIQVLGAGYLIRSVGFLAIYFVSLWIWLRWRTTQKVERALRRDAKADTSGDEIADWANDLLLPLRRHVERLQSLADRIAGLRLESPRNDGRAA